MATASHARSAADTRMEHLELANEIRVRRAALKRRIASGELTIVAVLAEPEWPLFSMPVHELLMLAPGWGRVRVSAVLRRAEVWPLREVGALTPRQRERLVQRIARGGLR